MRKDEVLGIIQQEKARNINNNRINGSKFSGNGEANILAQVVDHCYKNKMTAKFKDIDKIVDLIKDNLNYEVISAYGNIVIYNSIGDLVVQCTRNDKDDLSKITTSMVTIQKNGKVIGDTRTYVMKKEMIGWKETFSEQIVSDGYTDDKEELDIQIKICSSLFNSVMKKLISFYKSKGLYNNSMELLVMFNEYKEDEVVDNKKVSL